MEKIKNLAFFRFISFLLVFTFLFCSSAFMFSFTVSAEDEFSSDNNYDKDLTFGTLKTYPCIKLSYTSEIDYLHLRNLYYQSNTPYMIYSLFGVDSTGKLQHIITSYGEKYTYNTYTGFKFAGISDGYYNDKLYKFKLGFKASSDSTSCFFSAFRSDFSSDNFISYSDLCSFDKSLYSDLYIVYQGVTDKTSSNLNSFISDVSSNVISSDFETAKASKADFITFPKTSNDIGLLPIYLKSWLTEGYQYPYLEFYIDSDTLKESYTLTISSIDVDLYDRHKGLFQGVDHGSLGLDKFTIAPHSTGNLLNDLNNISNAFDLVPDVPVNPSWTSDLTNSFQKDLNVNVLKRRIKSNASFVNSVDIVVDSMNFNESDDIIRYYSLCLSDYIDISNQKVYRLEISNGFYNLATTYFASYDSFPRSSTPVGDSFSVGYTDRSQFDSDASNGTYVSGSRFDLNAFNNNDTPAISPNTNLYNNIGNGDFFTALDSTLKGLQGFFYGCYAIIPPAIISIILGSLAIIIVMRVLGR